MKRFNLLKTFTYVILASLVLISCNSNSNTPANTSVDANTTSGEPTIAESTNTESDTNFVVGLDDTFAPMGFRDTAGNLVGFDIDLANAVSEEMGVTVTFQPINWDAKEMELSSKNIDCIWNGMSRTPEREESMNLSQNYLNNKIIIMTTKDVTITDIAQLKDYKIGTQAKSSALEVIQNNDVYDSIKDNLSEYPTYDECILDMQAGRVQVMIVDEVLGMYKNANLEQKFNVSTIDFGEDFYCIGFRKDDDALRQKVESALKTLIENGKANEISTKWFGENLVLPIN